MQNNLESVYTSNGRYYVRDRVQKHLQFDRESDESMDISFEFDGSDQPQTPNSNLPLQTVNAEVRDPMLNYRLDLKSDQNKDLANYSNKISGQEQDYILEKEEVTAPSCWGTNSFSAKFEAPVKKSKRDHYKNLLKDFDRKEFSGKAFMSKLNKWDNEQIQTSVFNDKDIEMSLESHLENLSRQYRAKNKKVSKTEKENSEDLHMKIQNNSKSGKGLRMTLQSRRRYYQKLKKANTSICVSFSAALKHLDLERYLKLFKDQRGSNTSLENFFKIFGKDFWESGTIISIRVNDEPIFPVKTTLDYLWSQYKNSKARVIIA